ncbi:hypothetical protein [Thalassobaculum litoreum]|uniref:Phage tail tube protein, GTA-gp10 n=1 Tax=Thalassobaculum litoreum DSM 18839 TaxID=1123362 RepID=A0A8G2F1G8_9PROT|nr:hypothetical protein [Thalassobaculum litoreum]SDF15816.1 hypothetical protein SAMN05660686_00499 [Thalassobaculum litoreum DSM 18839]
MTTKKATAPKTTPAAGHPLTLNGETVMLVPTARAMMDISQAFGGLVPAIQRVQAFDVNAVGGIIHIALGRPRTNAKMVEKTVAEVCAGDLTEATVAAAGYLSDAMSGKSEAQKPAA